MTSDSTYRAPDSDPDDRASLDLRPYQSEGIDLIREAWDDVHAVLFALPMAAGKTFVGARIVSEEVYEGARSLVLVPTVDLIEQWHRRLTDDGVPPDMIGVIHAESRRARPDAQVQIATVATLQRRAARPDADLVLIDEAHHIPAETWTDAVSHYVDRRARILGLTATPCRLDGKPLAAVFERLVVGASPSRLVELGAIERPRVFGKGDGAPDLKGIRVAHGDYAPGALGERMSARVLIGDAVEHWKREARGAATVAFCATQRHARRVADALNEAGVSAECVFGGSTTAEREAAVDRLRSGATKVVCTCLVFGEGLDAPEIKCALLLRPTRSLAMYLQQTGRPMRPWYADGVRVAPVILDHAGNYERHGFPHDDREWSLTSRVGYAPGGDPVCKACPQCETVVHAGVLRCEACGFEFPNLREPEQTDGELQELNAASDDEVRGFYETILARARTVKSVRDPEGFARKACEARYGKGATG